ncbi:Lysosomal Pro-X carboxypeptidase [Blattella germanica]|nr:Lysosomal Pro-X carboxypeptidase [Blattella germanica]
MSVARLLSSLLLFVACASAVSYSYRTEYLDVPVDHFGFSNNATFKLRYLVNDSYWHQHTGSPIFFYTGNEGDIELFAQNTGFMWEIAPDFRALVVFAEHRYYGKSLPFGNKSYNDTKHLGYLTSQQALADYVWLINNIQRKQDRPCPVVAFGGSYGGMLAAYFRMKYPNMVVGAIAASAPIFQFQGLTPCGAFAHAGRKWLSTNWNLCKSLNNTNDVVNLKDWLSDVYTNLAMINYPYPTEFLAPVPANPVEAMCRQLGNSSLSDKLLLKSLFKAITVYFNYTGKAKCLDIEMDSSSLGDQGWDFQACTEMVMPMCSDGHNDMFEPQVWNFAKYSEACYKKWKVRADDKRAILMYGGKDISTATNIVFSNGLLDPWSSGGVLRNVSSSTFAVIIPEGAHHLDLRGSNPDDPISVVKARKFHRSCIRSWIKNFDDSQFTSRHNSLW